MTDQMQTLDTFAPYLNQRFELVLDDGQSVLFELIEVTSFPNHAKRAREPFSLLWRGPKTPILPQRIYQFRHSVLGLLEIFIVPVGMDETGVRYEAVFN